MYFSIRLLSSFLLVAGFCACANDQLPEPTIVECDSLITYTDTIKAIIDYSCAYDGCHVAGFGTGDYSSYSGMQGVINSGALKEKVIDLREMPPPYVPVDKPQKLSDEELMLLQCWMGDGYPE